MNKKELINALAQRANMTKKQTDMVFSCLIDTIVDTLKTNEPITITGFGSFGIKARAARKGRNPNTGEELEIAASRVPYFKAFNQLKSAINS